MRKSSLLGCVVVASVAVAGSTRGAIVVDSQQITGSADNTFTTVPLASSTDYLEGAPGDHTGASTGTNANGASISATKANAYPGTLSDLTDGLIAQGADDPDHNYFTDTTYNINIDLGSVVSIEQFNTYSRHTNARLPQSYTLIGSNNADFSSPTTLATVSAGDGSTGGELGVSIHDSSQTGTAPNGTPIGSFRYLQMQISNGVTFYSEVDVVAAPEPASVALLAMGAVGLLARRRRGLASM